MLKNAKVKIIPLLLGICLLLGLGTIGFSMIRAGIELEVQAEQVYIPDKMEEGWIEAINERKELEYNAQTTNILGILIIVTGMILSLILIVFAFRQKIRNHNVQYVADAISEIKRRVDRDNS